MYKIEKKDYGYKLIFSGTIDLDEMKEWVRESEKALVSAPSNFGVLVDMRDLKPLESDAKTEMEKGQKLYKDKGMQRSAVILNSAILTVQFKNIARKSGIYQWERYLNASKVADWEKRAVDWIKNGVDPDK